MDDLILTAGTEFQILHIGRQFFDFDLDLVGVAAALFDIGQGDLNKGLEDVVVSDDAAILIDDQHGVVMIFSIWILLLGEDRHEGAGQFTNRKIIIKGAGIALPEIVFNGEKPFGKVFRISPSSHHPAINPQLVFTLER